MAVIKKLKESELIGGTQNADVYPITHTKAVYDSDNQSLDSTLLTIKQALETLKYRFEVLLDDPNQVEGVIDTFREIEEFLRGVHDRTTLYEVIESMLVPLNNQIEALDAKIFSNLAEVVQTTGSSTNQVMSQKATTDALDSITPKVILQSNTEAIIEPNVLNKWEEIDNLTLTLNSRADRLCEFMIQFTCGSEDFYININNVSIKWTGDPEWKLGNTYQISIINDLAVFAEWEEPNESI